MNPKILNKKRNVLAICFDYKQNIQLPQVPVQTIFYLQQLIVSAFCIHNIKNKTEILYVYHEGEGRKGPNEVCSFLDDYLKDNPPDVTKIYLFSDNCGEQDKNHALSRYVLALTNTGSRDGFWGETGPPAPSIPPSLIS